MFNRIKTRTLRQAAMEIFNQRIEVAQEQLDKENEEIENDLANSIDAVTMQANRKKTEAFSAALNQITK